MRTPSEMIEVQWDVDVYGYDTEEFRAASAPQARYRAWKQFRQAYPISFLDFLRRGVKVRRSAVL